MALLRQHYTVLNLMCQVRIFDSDPKPPHSVTQKKSPQVSKLVGFLRYIGD
jgi:hypothetical protein